MIADMNNNRRRKLASQSGLTLIEMMAALLIVSVSVLAMYIMFINGNSMMMEQYEKRVALEKARGWLERMHYVAMKVDTVPKAYAGAFQDTLVLPNDDFEPIFAERTISVEHSTTRNPQTSIPFYSYVIVTYVWESRAEESYEIELRAVF